ncbi:MAG: class I SAM-dependent methyltransferase [Anaerolineales bacterium]
MPSRLSFDHFDWIAPIYDVIIPDANIEALIQYGGFPTNGKVLDVGGGTGRVTRQLINLQPDITIADSSFGMLKIANQKLGVKLTLCEAERMPFSDNSFERILLIDTLHHVADASRTLRECLRVLKMDGLLIVQEPDIDQWGGVLIALFEKLLLMRSHLLPAKRVQSVLAPLSKEVVIHRDTNQYWVVCRK